jgi:hypothetical protein
MLQPTVVNELSGLALVGFVLKRKKYTTKRIRKLISQEQRKIVDGSQCQQSSQPAAYMVPGSVPKDISTKGDAKTERNTTIPGWF